MLGNFFMLLLSSVDFFKINFSKNSFGNTTSVSNSLDPDQNRHFVGSDLDPNCLQMFADSLRQQFGPRSGPRSSLI